MSNMAVHFSSEESTWETPADFFAKCDDEFHFTVDVCATAINAKVDRFFSPEEDFFKQDTSGEVCWLNPPYGDPEHPCRQPYERCTKQRCQSCTEKCESDCKKHRGHHIDEYVPGILDFMRQAYNESLRGATYVCLVPARTDTEWFQDYAMRGEIRFLRGRLKFGNSKNCAPFPSALVIFRPPSELAKAS